MNNIALVSLGCAKNLVDSEVMLGVLKRAGYGFTGEFEKADVIIINNDIRLLEKGIRIAKKTRFIATENIIFSMGVKVLFLALSAFGVMWMWLSIFADVGVTLLCVLNALRLIYIQKYVLREPREKRAA